MKNRWWTPQRRVLISGWLILFARLMILVKNLNHAGIKCWWLTQWNNVSGSAAWAWVKSGRSAWFTTQGIEPSKTSALIQRLNPIICGWSKYDSTVCSRQSYRRLDQCLFFKLRAWAIRRHPTKSGGWKPKRYWYQTEGRLRFSTPDWSHRL